MAYVDSTRRFVLFGGSGVNYDNRTWSFDPDGGPSGNGSWHVSGNESFDGVVSNAMAYDPVNDVVLMFGGTNIDGFFAGATLEFDPHAAQWNLHIPTPRPGPRSHVSMAFDPASQRIVMFGGSTNTEQLDETWLYDAATHSWELVDPPTRPSARSSAHMAVLNGVPTLFGGTTGSDETWQWDGIARTWTQLLPATRPAGRMGGMLVSTGSRLLLHAGEPPPFGAQFNDVWAFDGVDWQLLQADAPATPVVYPGGFAYDSSRHFALRVGGFAPDFVVLDEVQKFDDELPAATPYGAGCDTSDSRPSLSASPPAIGGSWTIRVSHVGSSSPTPLTALYWGTSDRDFAGVSLPLSLDFAGRPDCMLRTSVDIAVVPLAASGGAIDQLTLSIPNDPNMLDGRLFLQAAVIQGLVYGNSNGLAARLR